MTETHRSGANNRTHRQLGETRYFQDNLKRESVHLEAVKKIQSTSVWWGGGARMVCPVKPMLIGTWKTSHTDAGCVSHFYLQDLEKEEEEQKNAWTTQRESRNAHLVPLMCKTCSKVKVKPCWNDFIYKSVFGKYFDNGARKRQHVSVLWQMIRKNR